MKKLLDPITKIDLDEEFEKYDEKNKEYRDEILTGLDKVMKELETIREEDIVGRHQVEEKLDDHEKRIINFESSTP